MQRSVDKRHEGLCSAAQGDGQDAVAKKVYTIESHLQLARTAGARFRQLGYDNIRVHVGDGTLGWIEHAPYDAIVVTAGGPEVPDPLLEQLAIDGRLVIPVGGRPNMQQLVRVRRTSEQGYQDMTREMVQASPEFDPSAPVNREYDVRLYDFYGRPEYWE